MTFRYCGECGEKLSQKQIGDEGMVPYCEACKRPWFPLSTPCVICLVVNEYGEIALIKQTYATTRNVCVAGYIAQGETAEHCAAREVQEEVGLKAESVQYIASYHYPKNDNLMLGFVVKVKKAEFHLSESEVERASWFSLEDARTELDKGTTGKQLLRDWLNCTK